MWSLPQGLRLHKWCNGKGWHSLGHEEEVFGLCHPRSKGSLQICLPAVPHVVLRHHTISRQAGGPEEMPESGDIIPVRVTIFEVGPLCGPGWPFTREEPASIS